MVRQRAPSNSSTASSRSTTTDQELNTLYDYLAKIILLGPSSSGKSCLLHRYLHSSFRSISSHTIGVEFASRIVRVGSSSRKRIKLQLWDTAGQERFRSVTRSYYRGAAGALLIYDVTDPESFTALATFLADVRALAGPSCQLLLIGNKTDLIAERGRAVSKMEVERWARREGFQAGCVMETSALTGEGVDGVFEKIAGVLVTKLELGVIDPEEPGSGIQYGERAWAVQAGERRSMRGWKRGLREWEHVFRNEGRGGCSC